nr:hypothetical protein BaRGS_003742 [Batillaria attramentaria]
MLRHCKRRTRGAAATERCLRKLITSLMSATDGLGMPLFKDTIMTIWEEQKRHIPCLQDPPGVNLYTRVDNIRCFDIQLQGKVNALSREMLGRNFQPNFQLPEEYTEDIDIACDGDNNSDIEEDDDLPISAVDDIELQTTLPPEQDKDLTDQLPQDEPTVQADTATDASGLPAWNKVLELAHFLVQLKSAVLMDTDAKEVCRLYDQLLAFDKQPLQHPRIPSRPTTGRYRRTQPLCLFFFFDESFDS